MVFFKSCGRCRGDQVLFNDFYGSYKLCLMCGSVTYPEEETRVEGPAERGSSADEPAPLEPLAAVVNP